jgi:hypothetical protein
LNWIINKISGLGKSKSQELKKQLHSEYPHKVYSTIIKALKAGRQRWSRNVAHTVEITAYRKLLEKYKGRDELGDVNTGDMPTINPTSVLFFSPSGCRVFVQNVVASFIDSVIFYNGVYPLPVGR